MAVAIHSLQWIKMWFSYLVGLGIVWMPFFWQFEYLGKWVKIVRYYKFVKPIKYLKYQIVF